jgi:molybdate transport system substrate-binding protein
MNKFLVVVLAVLVLVFSFANSNQPVRLTVFAASSLTESFTEIGLTYQRKTGVQIQFQFAGSQILETQIRNGAPADVFASADEKSAKQLEDQNLLEKSRTFALNGLVVITPKSSARVKSLADLALPKVKLVIAQASVPIGAYSRQVLKNLEDSKKFGKNFSTRVLSNVVSEENNVRQVALKVQLGEADAGLVYLTDLTPQARVKLNSIAIPKAQNVVVAYQIGTLKPSKQQKAALAFMQYVLSVQGQGILRKWGFLKKP